MSVRTRRSSGSWKSGSSGNAAEPEGGVVEHRVGRSRRGSGRLQVGGGDRLHPLGVEARGLQHRLRELEPAHRALVGDVEQAGATVDDEPVDHHGEVVGERRVPALVVDERERVVLAGEAQDGLHHVAAVLTADPRRAHDRRLGAGLDLATQFRSPVDRLRIGCVPLDIGLGLRAVEHVVGRHREHVCVDAAARFGDVAVSERVDPIGTIGVAFTRVDCGPRGAVDDGVGLAGRDRLHDRVAVADVERRVIGRDDLVVCGLAEARQTSRPTWPPAPVTRIFTCCASTPRL